MYIFFPKLGPFQQLCIAVCSHTRINFKLPIPERKRRQNTFFSFSQTSNYLGKSFIQVMIVSTITIAETL